MISILSLITSVKDYLEVVHKFIEYDSVTINYTELGSMLTFFLISIKNCILDFFSFSWLLKQNFWSLPIIIPDISSAMISEISVLDGYFHNAFNFLDTPISYGQSGSSFGVNGFVSCLEKLTIGLINSFFLFLPTSTAHIITLRRFVMQGLDAGYIAGLGTIAGNVFWLGSVILGFRFFVIPWLSLDIFRYLLGFILLVKYMWDSYNERKPSAGATSSLIAGGERGTSETVSFSSGINQRKIFLLNFLLALTEQTSIYPFISNISMNPEMSILETFQLGSSKLSSPMVTQSLNALVTSPSVQPLNEQLTADSSSGILFICIHLAYLLGITLGSLSLLHLSCWFWENPAFKIYMWVISSFKVSTSFYYKVLNFGFLYLTMLSAICSIPYYGLDYTITNPLGYVSDDRIIQDKVVLETSFLGTKASDRNTRRNRGRHGRRERWKRRIRKYRTFDASLYDQGIYDLFTVEDLNYGFDRFWLRRKLRNHRVRFRFFPGPWMRSFKKQLAKPRLESYTGPRIEFFRILFEQVYHPSFHSYRNQNSSSYAINQKQVGKLDKKLDKKLAIAGNDPVNSSLYFNNTLNSQNPSSFTNTEALISRKSTLKKFMRKFDNRVNTSQLPLITKAQFNAGSIFSPITEGPAAFGDKGRKNQFIENSKPIYSKQWKNFVNSSTSFSYSQIGERDMNKTGLKKQLKLNHFYLTALLSKKQKNTISVLDYLDEQEKTEQTKGQLNQSLSSFPFVDRKSQLKKLPAARKNLSKKDLQILHYRSLLTKSSSNSSAYPQKEIASLTRLEKQRPLPLEGAAFNPLSSEGVGGCFAEDSLMLLHPLKFYLQKEAGFKRKLRYYSPSIYRKFSVENNAPYFRVMMKRYFYNYKPSLRWERTMKVASLRKARRKTTRIPRKLQNPSYAGVMSTENREGGQMNSDFILGASGIASVPPQSLKSNSSVSSNSQVQTGSTSSEGIKQKAVTTEGKGRGSSPGGASSQVGESNFYLPIELEKSSLNAGGAKSSYNYSVVSKRANRYRYQIYKDVLQHWYYSPFNRILLKLDVDSFIRRQPNTHFLTAKEENLLHLRRFLLSEHYNTLRWYTNMEHYRSLKTQLNGGTKSFSSRMYNQQFSGTFKKIRHLFAITPSMTNMTTLDFVPFFASLPSKELTVELEKSSNQQSKGLKINIGDNQAKTKKLEDPTYLQPNVLKFDQPLYNEYANTSSNPLLNPLIIHEELLPDLVEPSLSFDSISLSHNGLVKKRGEGIDKADLLSESVGNDLLSQSQNIVRQYLIQTRSVRENYIKKLLNENNYSELTKFIYKGQKTRGTQPATNQKLLNDQEKDYLLTFAQTNPPSINVADQIEAKESAAFLSNSYPSSITGFNREEGKEANLVNKERSQNLYFTYLKNWKRHVNDQESLKNYLTRRLDKREKRKQKKEKQLLIKLQRLENWFALPSTNIKNFSLEDTQIWKGDEQTSSDSMLTSGLQKSILDGIFTLKNSSSPSLWSQKSQREGEQEKSSVKLGSIVSENPNHMNEVYAFIENDTKGSLDVGKKALLLTKIRSLKENNEQNSAFGSKQNTTLGEGGANINNMVPSRLGKTPFVRLQDISLRFNDIKYAQNMKLSNNFKTSIQATRKFIVLHKDRKDQANSIGVDASSHLPGGLKHKDKQQKDFDSSVVPVIIQQGNKKIQLYNSFKNQISTFNNICLRSATIAQSTLLSLLKQTPLSLGKVLKPIERKSLKDWRKKERVLGKQKRSRKELKLLNKKTESISTYVDFFPPAQREELELALQQPLRQKREINANNFDSAFPTNQTSTGKQVAEASLQVGAEVINNEKSLLPKERYSNLLVNTFKRKRSPQRRSRVRRNRGVFKKRSLSDSLRKDFFNFYSEKDFSLNNLQGVPSKERLKSQYYAKFNENLFGKYSITPDSNSDFQNSFVPNNTLQTSPRTGFFGKITSFLKKESETPSLSLSKQPYREEEKAGRGISFPDEIEGTKQRKSKQRKERYWKQKRSKYAQKRRKYRKRRRYTIVKIRTLNKQFKRIKNQIEIQNWWWKQFIPSIQASNEALWQIEKDKLIQQKLSQLSTSQILEKDALNSSNFDILQIGNTDFKPLAVPQAIRLNKQITESKQNHTLLFSQPSSPPFIENSQKQQQSPFIPFATIAEGQINGLKEESNPKEGGSEGKEQATVLSILPEGASSVESNNQKFQVINKLYESLFIAPVVESQTVNDNKNSTTVPFMVPNTNLPFYAGWDESLRKLIVTNRMLSRKEAGFSLLGALPNQPNSFNSRNQILPSTNPKLDPLLSPLTSETTSFSQPAWLQEPSAVKAEYTLAPLQGMNAATTLYWQIPFTTYDPDQFFALGMDGFSPIGWRKFLFRHSILKTWLANTETNFSTHFISNQTSQSASTNEFNTFKSNVNSAVSRGASEIPSLRNTGGQENLLAGGSFAGGLTGDKHPLIVKNRHNLLTEFSLLSLNKQNISPLLFPSEVETKAKKNSFAVSRRLKKRYRRVKKHPRTPVWFPSGPLLNQVLPVHYIYVFYKRARLPRDRYLKRRLMNVKDFNSQFNKVGINNSNQTEQQPLLSNLAIAQNYDFTLRKRLKPKRKYHLKRDYYASNVVIPRRFKFMSISSENQRSKRWRPLSNLKIHKPISEVVKEQQLLRRSAQQKQRSSKQQQPSMRVKQLRRRVQRQILRSVWRYRPRAGGFVWPGDYLKLELIKAPKLQPHSKLNETQQLTMSSLSPTSYGENGVRAEENFDNNLTDMKKSSALKQKRKKKRTLVEWQIQPKKYLYEKHNIRVLKKKLLKSFIRPYVNQTSSQHSFDSNKIQLNVLRNLV